MRKKICILAISLAIPVLSHALTDAEKADIRRHERIQNEIKEDQERYELQQEEIKREELKRQRFRDQVKDIQVRGGR